MRLKFSLLLCNLLISTSLFAQSEARFLSQPCLSPDATTVVFSFEGDLWKANVSTGESARLTAMQGYESNAKYSPD